jgi:DNA end-binding protein Ku
VQRCLRGKAQYVANDLTSGGEGSPQLKLFRVAPEAANILAAVQMLSLRLASTSSHFPRGQGLLGMTLRYPYEVRKEDEYFEDIPDEKIPKDMLELASHIVETKSGHFEPEKFEDQYEDALKELLKKKPKHLKSAPQQKSLI